MLSIKNVSATNNKGVAALRGVSLDVRAGEIVSVAGVAGNGQSELAEVITGMRECTGSITVNGVEVANKPPRISIGHGVSHVPEDRTHVGSAPNMTITENVIMNWRIARSPSAIAGGELSSGT